MARICSHYMGQTFPKTADWRKGRWSIERKTAQVETKPGQVGRVSFKRAKNPGTGSDCWLCAWCEHGLRGAGDTWATSKWTIKVATVLTGAKGLRKVDRRAERVRWSGSSSNYVWDLPGLGENSMRWEGLAFLPNNAQNLGSHPPPPARENTSCIREKH